MARSFAEQSRGRFQITLAGPRQQLDELGASAWSPDVVRIVDWKSARYSVGAELQWNRVRKAAGETMWYFPHWDVPWHALPSRYVVTIHDLAHLQLPNVAVHRRFLARHWIRRAVTRATRVTVVTEFTRRQLLATFPIVDGKLEVIPNGVEPLFFQATKLPAALAALVPSGPFMLSVGNLKGHKNLSMGPEVLARLPDLSWIVVGEWFPDWREVERHARALGVSNRITYLGRQPDGALNALYRHAVCLFFPSRYEGFGLPVLEALASGTPVVAANAEGSKETLAEMGWICDPDSPDEFARAVQGAVTAGRAAGARGVSHAQGYTWSSSAEKLASVIQAVHATSLG